MSFDKDTRNLLARLVADARSLLTDEFTKQFQEVYGIQPNGTVTDLERMTHLSDEQRATARLLRDRISHLVSGLASEKKPEKTAVDRVIREQAFTVLNRFAALRMAEERGIVQESVRKGMRSDGFQVYLQLAGTALGEQVDRYRTYLFCLFDDLSVDMGLLFDRFSSFGLLFPRENELKELLEIINLPELSSIWSQDEAIGWIYQYFNTKEERQKMRKESAAPRNSRELAVRNQFFTPRYVVEFLTDNTLGRIWYEMTKGNTSLKDSCRYMVRRPNEVFLNEGEASPDNSELETGNSELSQEELLRTPVHIEHRPLKDPREIRLLDPACGSMHFGLYAFDLFETIYSEAWDLEEVGMAVLSRPEGLKPLHETYASKDEFLRDVPRLIIEHNIHGVDIDPRAAQIAGLSLWLRAQRSWKDQQVLPAERPQIRKSNIVCAEPMPGEKEMLKEFAASLKPKVLGQLLELIFDKMQLAGEAGSLLKIEEEIEEAIEKARADFGKELLRRKDEEGYLPGMVAPSPHRQASLFDFADLPDKTRFWSTAEQQILDALREYAELAESGDGVRRLFAEDAGKGFAFIDLCRKRYDAVVMNPPFGDVSKGTSSYLDVEYEESSNDLLALFTHRGLQTLHAQGLLGAITSRTCFFLSSFEEWREKIILPHAPPTVVADLGAGVLDAAMVETAAYCLRKGSAGDAAFFKLHATEDPETKLGTAVESINEGTCADPLVFCVHPDSFKRIPGAPFSYWVSERIRQLFSSHNSFGDSEVTLRVTNPTGDEFRYLRDYWECSPPEVGREVGWVPYAKGGSSTKFFYDVNLVAMWDDSIPTYKGYIGTSHRPDIRPASLSHFFRPGIMWPLRAPRLCAQIFPEGTVFSARSQCLFAPKEKLPYYLGLLNSSTLDYLFKAALGRTEFPEFIVGTLRKLPRPAPSAGQEKALGAAAVKAAKLAQACTQFDEVCHLFAVPSTLALGPTNSLGAAIKKSNSKQDERLLDIEVIEDEIDEIAGVIFELEETDRVLIRENARRFRYSAGAQRADQRGSDSEIAELTSWLFGAVVGRWDIRAGMSTIQQRAIPVPFDPLPVCPPGMLQNEQDLPAEPKDVPADYPLRISWPGILVDDENNSEDIVTRVREAIEVIWQDNADAIEQEACDILGVKTLRDYFGKPNNFFADHLKRYSKSRRQAPIYWPLSTASGSYTLWIYYHRLTDQTLYTCVTEFVEPKLDEVAHDIRQLEMEMGAAASPSQRDELEKLQEFHLELAGFRDELLGVAKLPYRPNLNDGVLITACPLWKLFRLKKWSTSLKKCWDSLEAGEYDWAHLAATIWPERVVRTAHQDRSIAIAHDLEELLWHEVEIGQDKQGNPKYEWQPQDLTEDQLNAIAENL